MSYKTSSILVDDEYEEPDVPEGSLADTFSRWLTLRHAADQYAAQAQALRDAMMEDIPRHAASLGETADETGSYWVDLPTPIVDAEGRSFSRIKKEHRVQTTLKPLDEIRGLLPPDILSRVIRTREEEYLDQDELYLLLESGLITEGELKSLFNSKVIEYFKPQKD